MWSPFLGPQLADNGCGLPLPTRRLRHGHKVWMDEDGIADVLKAERLGHEEVGMRGVYGHVSPAMRSELSAALQERWEHSLGDRARLARGSSVMATNALLAAWSGHEGVRVSSPKS